MRSVRRRRLDQFQPSIDVLEAEHLVEGLSLVERVHRNPRRLLALGRPRKNTI